MYINVLDPTNYFSQKMYFSMIFSVFPTTYVPLKMSTFLYFLRPELIESFAHFTDIKKNV